MVILSYLKPMKDIWKDYFSFNKRQRNGILVLVSLILVMIGYLIISDYFPSSSQVDFSSFRNEIEKTGVKPVPHKNEAVSSLSIDINSADTTVLAKLPKMTSYCAGNIVKYRKKLGGYYDKKQLKEVWGMDSSMYKAMFDKVWTDTTLVHKVNINTAGIKQLGYHPYIHYYLAKAIVNYRDEHGLFKSLNDLRKIVAVDDTTYAKITPYLTIGNH